MDKTKTALIVEDDPEIRNLLRSALDGIGCRLLEAENIELGIGLFQRQKPDVVVLDINLPDGSGLDFCRKVREHKSLFATPVIMLTAQGKIEEKVSGFEAGADQYLVKPVDMKELVCWVQALMRRIEYDAGAGGELVAGDLTIDVKAHAVIFGEARIGILTAKEFDLLYYLVKKRPHVVSRKSILTNLWHTVAVDHVVDTHISNLKKKLPPGLALRIQNVPGKGFRYMA